MTEYKVWAFARSAVPNLTALENQLEEVMREADKRGYILVNASMELKRGTELWRPALFSILKAVRQGRVNAVMVQSLDRLSHDTATLYRILRFLQNHGAVIITTKTSLKYELYLTGLENRLLAHTRHTRKKLPWEVFLHADRPASHQAGARIEIRNRLRSPVVGRRRRQAAEGHLPTRQCWLCPEMRRFVPRCLVVLVNSFWVAFRVCCM